MLTGEPRRPEIFHNSQVGLVQTLWQGSENFLKANLSVHEALSCLTFIVTNGEPQNASALAWQSFDVARAQQAQHDYGNINQYQLVVPDSIKVYIMLRFLRSPQNRRLSNPCLSILWQSIRYVREPTKTTQVILEKNQDDCSRISFSYAIFGLACRLWHVLLVRTAQLSEKASLGLSRLNISDKWRLTKSLILACILESKRNWHPSLQCTKFS